MLSFGAPPALKGLGMMSVVVTGLCGGWVGGVDARAPCVSLRASP